MESILRNFSIKIYNDKSNELMKDIHLTKSKDKNPFNVVEGKKIKSIYNKKMVTIEYALI